MQPVNPDSIPVRPSQPKPKEGAVYAGVLTPRLGFELQHLVDFLNSLGIHSRPFSSRNENGDYVDDQGNVVLPASLAPHVTPIEAQRQPTEQEAALAHAAAQQAEAQQEAPAEPDAAKAETVASEEEPS